MQGDIKDQAYKYDAGKTQWRVIPWAQMKDVAEIMSDGEKKYGFENWKRVVPGKERFTDALIRHLMAWLNGERTDPESGKHHLAHVICNCLFLIFFDKEKPAS
jgi:hypothetical protein